jgi:hypothetical protein
MRAFCYFWLGLCFEDYIEGGFGDRFVIVV